jgi:hypothetical protein
MTRTVAESFTLTNAKIIASKVTADMRRCQQLYGKPSDTDINNYGTELAILLKDGYVSTYEFGWVRATDDERILTWKYSVDSSGNLTNNDRPGRIIAGVDITGTSMRNRLCHTSKWFNDLTEAQREAIEKGLPIHRTPSAEYGSSLGRWVNDLCYSSGGVATVRQTFKLYGT